MVYGGFTPGAQSYSAPSHGPQKKNSLDHKNTENGGRPSTGSVHTGQWLAQKTLVRSNYERPSPYVFKVTFLGMRTSAELSTVIGPMLRNGCFAPLS